jgi:hypothetical protein
MKDLLKQIPVPKAFGDSWQGTPLPPTYEALAPKEGSVWYVDGGNAAILEAPHFSLQKMRAVAIRMPDKQVKRVEEYVLLVRTNYGWDLTSETGAVAGAALGELPDAITQARQQLEHALAKQCEGIVVLDGDVAPQGCIALQKSITVLTKNNFPLSSILTAAGPWAAKLGDVHAVKLHERARHVFLVHNASKEQLHTLCAHSSDCLFAGYPYGLVLADRLARVPNEEAQALKIQAKAMLKDLGTLRQAEASSDSHSILDSMG